MDVRCEKCLTVYEFDDAQVGPQGVTVKCTQCGNLFKVKRKEEQELPAIPSQPPPRAAAPAPPPRAAAPAPAPPPVEQPSAFLVRLALSGEVFQVYDPSMLKDWILERKITREDQISKDGASWKPLGGVVELQLLFRQAETPRQEIPLALTTTAPLQQPDGPSMMGPDDDVAHGHTSPRPRVTPPAMSIPQVGDDLAALEDEELFPQKRSRAPLVVLFTLIILGAGVGYVLMFQRGLVSRVIGGGARAQKSYQAGRAKFLDDTDEGFHQAAELFAEAHGADADDALPLAGLAEVDATWAWYLREDARASETAAPAAAATLRREAQGHLDDAKKAAQEALQLKPDLPEVNRAMADFLRVDGAPAAEVERYLKRALDLRPDDAEARYVAGALALREGKLEEARTHLEQARSLMRARFLLAKLDQQTGKLDEARNVLTGIVQTDPQHERAKALLAQLSAPAPATAPPTEAAANAPANANGNAPANVNANAPANVNAPANAPTGAKPANVAAAARTGDAARPAVSKPEPAQPGDYNKLVAQADRLSENGRADAARKLYERALGLNPQGVEAITGIAYCDLDKEKFLGAIDKFKQALAVSPEYGDALVGLAEAYKVQGNKPQAIDYYKRYLKALPHGPKAAMARQNLRDLEPREATPAEEPKSEGTSLPRPPDSPPPPP